MNKARSRQGEVLRVSAKFNPNVVAGLIANEIREYGYAITQTIGAGALNQAVKAVAIVRGFLAPSGLDIIMRPRFVKVTIQEQERTAVQLKIEPK